MFDDGPIQVTPGRVIALRGLVLVALASLPLAALAQTPAPAASGSAIVLPRDLALEEQLQIAKDERDGAINRVEQLQIEKQQLAAVIDRMVSDALDEVQRPRVEQAAAAREVVGRKLVAAMKGDWEKNDRWDWSTRSLVKADGTRVPLVPADAAKNKEPK
jgi:hypothetical protein